MSCPNFSFRSRNAIASPRINSISQRIWTSSLPELVVLLLAALPRFWRLEYHSVWFDEAVSLAWARADAAHIWRVTVQLGRDKHPPVYYLSLHYWQAMLDWFGAAERDAALRVFGVLMGILMVWGVVRLVTQLSGRATGLTAGLLTALAPMLVWYSQELRMFQPAATAVVWAAFFLVAARGKDPSDNLRNGQAATGVRLLCWLGFAAALLFSLYSYLYAAFFLPGLGLSILLLARRGKVFDRRYFFEASAALAVVALLFLPLARNAWAVNSTESTPGAAFADFLPNLWIQLIIFTVWFTSWPYALKVAAILFFAVLVLAGLTLPGKSSPDARRLLWLWIGGPLLIGNLLLATNASIFREDRYFLFLAPFVLWAAARGVGAIGRLRASAGLFSGATAVVLLAAALPVLWSPQLFRENWRAAADYISAYRQHSPGTVSATVIHPYFLFPALQWYLHQQAAPDELPIFGNFGGPLTPEQTETLIAPQMQEIASTLGADTVWLTQSHLAGVDDQRLVQAWLDSNFPLITEQYPTGIHLRGYAFRYRYPTLPALADTAIYPGAQIVPGVELAACEITTPVVAARDVVYHPPSGWVHLRLWLRAYDIVGENPTIYALVQSDDGQIWGRSLERSGDVLAVYPPTMWQLDEFVRVELDVNLNPLALPGMYNVKVEAAGQTGVPCGRVQLE